MALDVDPPPPPELDPVDDPDATYRREAIQEHLEAGAWEAAFREWAATTDLEAETFAIAEELGLFERFDFFWDDFADRVGYHAPGIPEDWQTAAYHADLDTWGQVSAINAALAEFGQTVCEILATEYLEVEPDGQG